MKRTLPERTVTLDAGVFDWLWGIVESKNLSAQNRRASWEVMSPEYLDLLERAVTTFRVAAGESSHPPAGDSPAAQAPPERRRVVRRKRPAK
jgi:hypothetical protein